jgi:hypothetical protein
MNDKVKATSVDFPPLSGIEFAFFLNNNTLSGFVFPHEKCFPNNGSISWVGL